MIVNVPHRDDEVAAWLKRMRDRDWCQDAWYAIDMLLDDYRLHADTGTPLSEEVVGPHGD